MSVSWDGAIPLVGGVLLFLTRRAFASRIVASNRFIWGTRVSDTEVAKFIAAMGVAAMLWGVLTLASIGGAFFGQRPDAGRLSVHPLLQAAGLIVVGSVAVAKRRALAARISSCAGDFEFRRAHADPEVCIAEGMVTVSGGGLVLAGMIEALNFLSGR